MNKRLLNSETKDAWNANASFWDEKMGEGNDFFNILLWPSILRMLEVILPTEIPGRKTKPGKNITFPLAGWEVLDIAAGNGLLARRLAKLGAQVTAIDFSENLISIARSKTPKRLNVRYFVIDATMEKELVHLGKSSFNCAVCNMALFDIAEIDPLFRALTVLLKPGGIFIFTLTHPAFNNSSTAHVAEELDDGEKINTIYSVKVSRYMTTYHAKGLAMRDQPKSHIYFERPLQDYLNTGFSNGFILDGFEEMAFPPEHKQANALSWGGHFSEIPPVLIARMRLEK
jgi:2-polyprenyl-3-methyl-5-hydroxy-6-metoxy-1,4-benzoquinol methylase